MPRLLIAIIVLATFSGMHGPPLSAQEAQWFKGNLHTHSLWSDGDDFPEMIAKWYVERDYNFLAFTDHNILSEGEKWMPLSQIEKRGGKAALEKYTAAMDASWIETRIPPLSKKKADAESAEKEITAEEKKQQSEARRQVRLKGLAEFRGMFETPGKFLLMTAEEISDSAEGVPVHMNATNLVKVIRPAGGSTVREAIANNMRGAIAQSKAEGRDILVHLNHPNFGWAVTAEDLASVLEEQFFEIYNGHPGVNQLGDDQHASLEKIWDIANTIRVAKLNAPPLMGLATDDGHNYHGQPSGKSSQPGRGWIMVKANKLKPASLIGAIKSGDFYASSGVTIEAINWDPATGKLEIAIPPVDGQTFRTDFIGTPKNYQSESKPRVNKNGEPVRGTRIYSADVGKTFASIEGLSPSYQMTGDELYIRAVITSSADHPNPSFKAQKQQAWVQPVTFKK